MPRLRVQAKKRRPRLPPAFGELDELDQLLVRAGGDPPLVSAPGFTVQTWLESQPGRDYRTRHAMPVSDSGDGDPLGKAIARRRVRGGE